LTFAVGDGDVDEVKRLVEDERVDINEGGGAPLQMAVIEGSFEIFSYLIDKGANVRARDDYGWTVFLLAARQGRVDMLKLLLDRGADINDRMKYWRKADSSTALIIAARYARDEAVYFLKAHGLSISNEKAVFMVGFEMRKQEDFWPKGDVILKTIDGKDMEGYGLLELEPGIHTAVLMYLSEIKEMDFKRTTTGFMSRVSIVAEQGHIYVVHANLSEDSWMPVVRDYSIR
jgi:ankyrin repeat protein